MKATFVIGSLLFVGWGAGSFAPYAYCAAELGSLASQPRASVLSKTVSDNCAVVTDGQRQIPGFLLPPCGPIRQRIAPQNVIRRRVEIDDSAASTFTRVSEPPIDATPMPTMLTRDIQNSGLRQSLAAAAERTQLASLWTAAIERSPDIQFVIQQLNAAGDDAHATSTAIKMISVVLFSVLQVAPSAAPAGLQGAGCGVGANLLSNMMRPQSDKGQQKVSKEQAAILYKIVRDTAEKLVSEYRAYRRALHSLSRARNDLLDCQAMSSMLKNSDEAARQLAVFTKRFAQRDLAEAEEDVRMQSEQLADLAGEEALATLQRQVGVEQMTLKRLCRSHAVLHSDSTEASSAMRGQVALPTMQ